MPASGRDGAELDVGRRPGQRAGVREAVEQRHDDLDQPLTPQLLVGVVTAVPRLSASRSAIREQSRLSTAATNTMATTKYDQVEQHAGVHVQGSRRAA